MKLTITTIFILLFTTRVFCCECEEITISRAYFLYDYIATGEIVRVYNPTKESYYIDFNIDNLIKGDSIKTLEVYSTPENYSFVENGDTLFYATSCDIYLREGEKWILFANQETNGNYVLDICSPTAMQERIADEGLQLLELLKLDYKEYVFPSYELDSWYLITSNRIVIDTIIVENSQLEGTANLRVRLDEFGNIIYPFVYNLSELQKEGLNYLEKYGTFFPGTINGNKVKSEHYLTIKTK